MTDKITIGRQTLQDALEALTESVDLVQNDYDNDWRHGMPTRKAQLDASLQALNQHKAAIEALRAALAAQPAPAAVPSKLWLWKNFVDGRPEYWAFDNPFPIHMDYGDPQTLGEPCGYAIFKPSRQGRTDVGEAEVLRRIAAAKKAA